MAESLAVLAECLVLTIIIETLGALILFRLRAVDALVVVVLAQVVTNPLVEACTIGAATYLPDLLIPIVSVLEVAAFAVEALIYRAKGTFPHPWLASAVLNALSLIAGFIIFAI